MIATSTMAAFNGDRAKIRCEILRVEDAMRLEAGAQMKLAFPGCLKRYALPLLPASTLSKARLAYACCPFFRAALCILALRVGGADRARAQRLVNWLQSWVDRLWPVEGTLPTHDLVPEKQAKDSAEDAARTAYLLDPNPTTARRWLAAIADYMPTAEETMRSLAQEIR